MSTTNTVSNIDTKNKDRQIGPFSYPVNTMVQVLCGASHHIIANMGYVRLTHNMVGRDQLSMKTTFTYLSDMLDHHLGWLRPLMRVDESKPNDHSRFSQRPSTAVERLVDFHIFKV